MKKNSADIFSTIGIDPISGEYYITIPEEVISELSWYEETKIKFAIEGNEVILTESED